MNRRNWMLAVITVLGIMLAGITGYLVWSAVHTRYVKAEELSVLGDDGFGENTSGSLHGYRGGDAPQDETGNSRREGLAGGDVADGAFSESGPGLAQDGQINAGQVNGEKHSGNVQKGNGDPEDPVIHLVFAGDILLSDHVLGAYNKAGNIGGVVDETFQGIIDSSDVFMVNQEFPFSSRGSAAADKQFTFRLPPEKVSIFQELGIDIVTLANNHALDYGTDALLDTCDTLDQAGIGRVGAGANLEEAKKPVIMDVKGKKIGFLGASRVIPVGSWNATASGAGMLTTYDPALLLEEIKKTRGQCDFVVVYVHWGIEKDIRPQDYQRTMGKQYIDAGADLVIGSHPHVLQGMEYYKGKPIVYSLGNFVFGSSIPKTALLTADWDGENLSLNLAPGTSSGGYTRALAGEADRQGFFQYMESLSYGAVIDENGCREEGREENH